jgi:hypothetical protein
VTDDKKKPVVLMLGDESNHLALQRELLDYEVRRRGVLNNDSDLDMKDISCLLSPGPTLTNSALRDPFTFKPDHRVIMLDGHMPDLSPKPADELRYWAAPEGHHPWSEKPYAARWDSPEYTADSERQKAKAREKREKRKAKAAAVEFRHASRAVFPINDLDDRNVSPLDFKCLVCGARVDVLCVPATNGVHMMRMAQAATPAGGDADKTMREAIDIALGGNKP